MRIDTTFETDESADVMREHLRLDESTGKLYWRKQMSRRVMAGDEAGFESRGIKLIKINGRQYNAHRIVWLLYKGDWPLRRISHIDGDGLNNRIDNLIETGYDHRTNKPRFDFNQINKFTKWGYIGDINDASC